MEAVGDLPKPREGHIAKIISKDIMLIHGGVDQSETSFNDTYILTGVNRALDQQQQQQQQFDAIKYDLVIKQDCSSAQEELFSPVIRSENSSVVKPNSSGSTNASG